MLNFVGQKLILAWPRSHTKVMKPEQVLPSLLQGFRETPNLHCNGPMSSDLNGKPGFQSGVFPKHVELQSSSSLGQDADFLLTY